TKEGILALTTRIPLVRPMRAPYNKVRVMDTYVG
ncbi:unnamed protein product, partial [marine sediment metagenome]